MSNQTRRWRLLASAGAAGTVAAMAMLVSQSGAAPIGPIDPVAATLGFTVMTEGDATVLGSENDGTMAVGGDLRFGNYQLALNSAGSFVVPGDNNPTALVVGGQVDFAGSVPGSRLQVLQDGYVKIGDLTGTFVRDTDNNSIPADTRILPANDYNAFPRIELVTQQPVSSVGPASPIDFAGAFATFRSTSNQLGTCQNTLILRTPEGNVLSSPIPAGSNAVVTLTAGQTNVLNIDAADLANIAVLTFATPPTADTPLLVNVDTSGVNDNFTWPVPNFAGIGGEQARYILFNFPTATSVTLLPGSATLEGTLYAPNADVSDLSDSNTEGNIIAKTFTHDGGEVHNFPFSTTLSCDNGEPTATPTQPTATPTATPTQPTAPPTTPPATPTATPTQPTAPPTTPTPSGKPTVCPTQTPHHKDPHHGGPPQPDEHCPPYPSHPPHLPKTGADLGPLLTVGGALFGAGALLLLISLRLRRRSA